MKFESMLRFLIWTRDNEAEKACALHSNPAKAAFAMVLVVAVSGGAAAFARTTEAAVGVAGAVVEETAVVTGEFATAAGIA